MTPTTIMVHLVPGTSNEALLRFTADVANRLKAKKVIGIGACKALQYFAGPGTYVPQDLIDQDFAEMQKQLKETETKFRTALKDKPVKLEWRSHVGHGLLADYVADQMRAADLLVTAPPQPGSLLDQGRQLDLADLVMRAGRSILVVRPEVATLDLRSVMVAWKDGREARRALGDAVALLKLADRVTVVETASGDALAEAKDRVGDVARWLEEHGVSASSRAEVSSGDDARQLSGIATKLGAGLVVGGAYGHSRLHEWVMGGVTRDLLLRPQACSFVSH